MPAADHQLAGVRGEVHLVAGEGGADRQRAGGGRVHRGQRQRVPGHEGHLGGAVAVDQPAVGGEPFPAAGRIGVRGLLAAEQHHPDRVEPPFAEGVQQVAVDGGRAVQHGGPVPVELLDGVCEPLAAQVDGDDGGAGEQRRVEVGDGGVEAERGEQAEPVGRADRQRGDLVVDDVRQVAVGLPDRLGHPGGARGEQHVRQRVRVDRDGPQRGGRHLVERHHGPSVGECPGQLAVLGGAGDGGRPGGGEHVAQPVDREARVQRHVRAPGGEGAEQRRDGRGAVRGEQGDPVARPGAGGDERGRVPPGRPGQLGVTDLVGLTEQSRTFTVMRRDLAETIDDHRLCHVSGLMFPRGRQARSVR
ncbi:hypothetical protein B0E53_04684 [Micromonospora sp. MH33]|nr:hypothetical protein B0E53_04684 [Micromonospora sp. MH33]